MSEDWTAIASEVADAIGSVGFTATLSRKTSGPELPWDLPATGAVEFSVTIVDSGWRQVYGPGMVLRAAHMVTVAAEGTVPAVGDTLTFKGLQHHILRVDPLAPGGVDLLYDIEVEA